MADARENLPTDWHSEHWPLGIYPAALDKLKQEITLRQVLVDGTSLWLYFVIMVTLCLRNIPQHISISIACFCTVALLAFFTYLRILLMRRASWCLKHLDPTRARMKITHSPKDQDVLRYNMNRLVILHGTDVEIRCEPVSTTLSELYVKYGTETLPVRLWSHPVTLLPAAAECHGEIILLQALAPRDWDKQKKFLLSKRDNT